MLTVTGIASYPHFNTPDTKFDDDGVYHTKLIIDADTAEPLVKELEEMRAQEAARVAKEVTKGKKPKDADLPVQPEMDDDGNETGNFVLKAKMKASGVSKKTQKPWNRKLPLFDGAGKPMHARVGGGSKVSIAIDPAPYYSAKDKAVGVTLRLEAVQVLELRSGEGASAGKFGFGKVDGAFEASDETPAETTEGGEKKAGDYDF